MAEPMKIKEIVNLKETLSARDAVRDSSYDELMDYYGGTTMRHRRRLGFFPGIINSLTSIFSPSNERDEEEDPQNRSPINLIKPAVLNKVAFLALPPTVRVIEPPSVLAPAPQLQAEAQSNPVATQNPVFDAEQWAADIADLEEQAIDAMLRFSNVDRRAWDLAWSCQAMGGGVLGVWPDMRHKRPRFFTRTPQYFYPISYDADGLELDGALWVDWLDGRTVVSRWGDAFSRYASQEEVEVMQYIDKDYLYTIIDDKVFAHDPIGNPLGIVPIVCIGNIGVPGSVWGDTDFRDAIPVAKEINYHMGLTDEMVGALIKPTIAIKDWQNVSEEVAIGSGGVIQMGANGAVELLGPMNVPPAFWNLGQTLENWFDLICDNPAILRSQGIGNIVTGKGFNATISPITARLQIRCNLIMAAWAQVIRYALQMWWKFPGMKNALQLSGTQGKGSYYVQAKPSDFVINGDMWTEVQCFLSSASYMDRQGTDVELMQLYQNELISWDTAVENLPYVSNKRRERTRIDRDRQWKAEGLAEAQEAAQSAMTANPNMAQQVRTEKGLTAGRVGEVGPPASPMNVRGPGEPGSVANLIQNAQSQQGGPQAGAAAPDLMSVLTELFASIPNLKGDVWIGGSPAVSGTSEKVTVWVDVASDKGTITRFVQANAPELYGKLEFIVGQPDPNEPTVQVVTQGQPSGGGATPPPTPGGMPPGMNQPPSPLTGIGG